MNNDFLSKTHSESFPHKAIKQLIYKFISDKDKKVIESNLEKGFKKRRADVYFKLSSRQEVVVEIQNSNITIKEVIERTRYYNNLDIHVLWILYGKGKCLASPKAPEDRMEIKISPIENFLHTMYGGRVYYVTINVYHDRTTIVPPYALHFSLPSKKSKRKIYTDKYQHYYLRNSNYMRIPSWDLLCTEYNGYKIARFYDKNVRNHLKSQILDLYNQKTKNNCCNYRFHHKKSKESRFHDKCIFTLLKKKRLINQIFRYFGKKYGSYMIKSIFSELILEKKVIL